MNKLSTGYLLTVLLLFSAICCSAEELSEGNDLTPAPSGTLPIMHIETANRLPITSKTVYVDATCWIEGTSEYPSDGLGTAATPLSLQIRGRGHSSWKGDKKPYKLKFATKTSFWGMPKNKHWALLKPSENTVAGLKLGKLLDMPWTPDFRPVEVVLNDDYIGLYFLTETIRIDKDRVNIFEQQENETDEAIIPYGWLVEIDNYLDECQITIPECVKWNLTLRYHSPEILSPQQLNWLTNEFNAINSAIYSSDKTSRLWEQYVDVESIARFFIVQEMMDNPDGFHGSFYLHKDIGNDSKWIAGPIWDLTCYNREKTDYTFRMKVHYTFTPHWIGEIIQYDSFCQAVAKIWKETYPNRLSELYEYVDDALSLLDLAWQNDCRRWNGDTTETAQFRADRIKKAIERNIDWFNDNLPVSPYSSFDDIYDTERMRLEVFNLQGIHIGTFDDEPSMNTTLTKGLYIVNGRKVLIQ